MNPNATSFWIETGAMQGGSRNQLELPNDIAEFFGAQARTDEVVMIQLAPGVQFIRPFVYRGDDYGHYTERWRLCLPTAQMGGPDYANRVARFDKLSIGGTTVFQLSVADVNSAEHQAWRNQSTAQDETQADRQFGWF